MLAVVASAAGDVTFQAATVKPHWGCMDSEGQARVQDYVDELAFRSVSLIALNQMQFQLAGGALPSGYSVFGGDCVTKHADNVAVLVRTNDFEQVRMVGRTSTNVSYLFDGLKPAFGDMCVAADVDLSGIRAYTGAVLRYVGPGASKDMPLEMCVLAATFPHCWQAWSEDFVNVVDSDCVGSAGEPVPKVFLVDSNAGCPSQENELSTRVAMNDLLNNHTSWGEQCSELTTSETPTCCLDIKKGYPYARYWFDRVAVCGQGGVSALLVEENFTCGADEEHKSTLATLHFSSQNVLV